MRFGIGGATDHTLEEIGQMFGVTRERIRQIEAKALEELRHPSRGHELAQRSWIDRGGNCRTNRSADESSSRSFLFERQP